MLQSMISVLSIEFDETPDPQERAAAEKRLEQFRKNSRWLEEHWKDLLPEARGKVVAVAGQEAYIADSAEQAWAWTAATHPEDEGPVVQYVPTHSWPRIYAFLR